MLQRPHELELAHPLVVVVKVAVAVAVVVAVAVGVDNLQLNPPIHTPYTWYVQTKRRVRMNIVSHYVYCMA